MGGGMMDVIMTFFFCIIGYKLCVSAGVSVSQKKKKKK